MNTADWVYLGAEAPSCGDGLVSQLQEDGRVLEAVRFPGEDNGIEQLKRSKSDCIVFYSPHEYGGWVRDNYETLRGLGKPLLAFVSECVSRNPHYQTAEKFHGDRNWFDFHWCSQASDVPWFEARGAKAQFSPLIYSDRLFYKSDAWEKRVPKFVFIGCEHWSKPERSRLLKAAGGLIDVILTPRTIDHAHVARYAYNRYAGVLCLPSHGRGQSIRLYEAAACGAALVECQDIDPGGEVFIDGIHRLSVEPGIADEEFRYLLHHFDFAKAETLARSAFDHAWQFSGQRAFDRLMAAADTALAST